MAIMALEELHDWSWVARGWEAMSLFVCFSYSFKAAVNIVSKLVGNTEVEETWDIVLVEALSEDNNCVDRWLAAAT